MRTCARFIWLLLALSAVPAFAQTSPPATPAPARRIDVEGRVMVWGDAAQSPAAGQRLRPDFLVRRARIAIQGRVSDDITVTVQAGQDNIGARLLAPDSGITIKDAYINYRRAGAFQLTAGQFKVPFLRANLESGFMQVLVDRGALPGLRPAREGSRDLGVMAWGNARQFQYRVALLDGSDQDAAAAPADLRVTARLAHNWFSRETGAGYTGSSLGASRVLQVAVQADVQGARVDPRDDAAFRALPRNYDAWALDAYWDQPVGRWAVTTEAAWLARTDDYAAAVPTRHISGYFGQGAVLLPHGRGAGQLQLAVRREGWDTERAPAVAETTRTTVGGTYYLKGHSRKWQADYTVKRETPEVANDEFRASFVVVF